MGDDGPQLVRPIPRRPFDMNLSSATPPGDDLADYDDPSQASFGSGLDFSSPRFLHPNFERAESAVSLSRPQSIINLTSSTLMGIYSVAASDSRDRLFNDNDEPDTPWGTGAHTPIRRPSVNEATYELMRDRSHFPRRYSSFGPYAQVEHAVSYSTFDSVTSLTFRGTLLFLLGLGYGALVTRLHNEQSHLPPIPDDSILKPGNNWRYLAFWGVAGVGLGSLLPWFDRLWDNIFGSEGDNVVDDSRAGPGTDWALVVRAIGAFVGIIFAIRKLSWASTLQVSATLALVNPLLWWLIDRSKPGFVLSAAVGLTGSILFLRVDPEIMPAPLGLSPRNFSNVFEGDPFTLGGLATRKTVETGVWMLSVLFCSCLCFGNIGRRLTWNRSSGRWGVVR
ncbi:INSIG domain-containing protein [Metarhizium album ARSEF 1941]|uniref:INSIG domain-containing protein n=1 Tax=Metarhizium album (strain ARSEF 1941) TaxID=1081103 RepID=A0A0B2X667_METAS|nr:INSIG domain-containing protein [Metarhizium album ARSEF 1941]KHO00766.1 INSIG domain-containing protein [Metarhizium album ARSEF 1941]